MPEWRYNGRVLTPILPTKVYKPPARPKAIARLRLLERLNVGLPGKLTLIFGRRVWQDYPGQ